MVSKNSNKFVIFLIVLFVVLVLYFFGLASFLEKYLWLVALLFLYIFFFISRDSFYKKQDLDDLLKIKRDEDIRINFWRCFIF